MQRHLFLISCLIACLTLSACQDVQQLLQQFLPAQYRNSNFTLDNAKQILKEKCKKAKGTQDEALYKEIEQSAQVLMACLSNTANWNSIQEEMEIARPQGELDTVFHKYCGKVPELEGCLETFEQKIQPCLTVKEQRQNEVLIRIIKGLTKFGCMRNGGTIALFIAESGPECLEANKDAISQCAKSAFSEFLPKEMNLNSTDLFNLPELVLLPEHCIDLQRFEACTIHHLEQCREVTPANVMQSVFKFIKNETQCQDWLNNKSGKLSVLKESKSADTQHISMTLLLITLLTNFILFNRE